MLKKSFLLFFITGIYSIAISQKNIYWQQQVNYNINVSLNDTSKTLDGFVSMLYKNNSPDTLKFIWFHLWPNAYKNDKTAFSDQLLLNGNTDFYFADEEKRGYINRLNFKVNNAIAIAEDHPQHQDIIKVILPNPLPPNDSITIETPFHVKLPYNFSRSGYVNNSFQITQWYPKPAVYDKYGWHEMPYLDQGEFYSEFGKFDVTISVAKDFKVAATGILESSTTLNDTLSLHYHQDGIHDFAWFADKHFIIEHDTLQLASKVIDVYAYHYKRETNIWSNGISFIKSAILSKSKWLGEYPYNIVTVVESNGENGGGMEYPTITLIEKTFNSKSLNSLINHEVGHNWFYGILASNERLHPWMDEGMNSYYDNRYNKIYNKSNADTSRGLFNKKIPDDFENLLTESFCRIKKDQPIETSAESFSMINYEMIAYNKTALWMQMLEAQLGQQLFDSVMHVYYERWKFKHPYPEDFRAVAEEISNRDLSKIFSLLNTKGSFYSATNKKLKIAAFFNFKNSNKYNHIFFSPAFGYNYYDKLMLGAVIHNYSLPITKFKFVVAPLFATGSKKINGIGRMSYSAYPGNNGQKLELSFSAAAFSNNNFTDSTGKKNYFSYSKMVPGIKYVFANKDAKSTITKYVQWKTYLINETTINFKKDTVLQQYVISYPKEKRFLNQAQFVIQNDRILYPYRASLIAEEGKGFLRLNLTGNYYFNYPKEGGLAFRFFAGKFIYTNENNFQTQYETDRYHLNMSGANGYEDYTYSNYFTGRNEFEGMATQQMMIRDGAFKVRTDLLSSKIGKTDNWLTAMNFTTTIPKSVNPLSVLPFKLPLKLFVDIGTYAETWKNNSTTEKFLYDAGFQLSLLNNIVNIYFPFIYSKSYSDYFKSTILEKRFLKNISFSIDIQNISLKKIFPQSPF